MWNYLTEKFLTEYFLYETALGNYLDGQAIFNLLGRIFLLSDDEKAFVGNLLESGNISEIKTESDYRRYLRIKKYLALTDIDIEVHSDEDMAITLKGAAIATSKAMGCSAFSVLTKLKIEEKLISGAESGNIAAMRLVGLMLSDGVLLTRDCNTGLRYLRMAASWNDIPSLMYSLHYDKAYTNRYAGKLGFLLKNAAHGEILPIIESGYGKISRAEHKEAKLLEKLFQLKVLQREIYSAPHARALFSGAISYKDKEKLLYTAGKDYMPLVGDLPLKLGENNSTAFDYSFFANMPLIREDEQRAIITRLNNSDLRRFNSYRPLCLSCDSVYFLQMYANVIANSAADMHTEYINVNQLDLSRFDHNKNNIFLRSCDEDRGNIYFMFFTGEISNVVSDQAKYFLKSDGRKRFNLNVPNISLNLGSILPICFCDLKNEKNLRDVCDVIRIADCSKDEKSCLLQYIMDEKAKMYGIPDIEIDESFRKKLLDMSVDEIAYEIDSEVSCNRKKGERLILTGVNDASMHRLNNGSGYGFGGFKQ